MKCLKFLVWGVFMAGIFCSQVEAGILMTSFYSEEGGDSMTMKTYLEKDRMRMESKGKEMDHVSIYRKDKEVIWMIDNKEKTYTEMTKAEMEKMKKQMEDAMKMMEEQMKNMPPEQKEQMEKMMPMMGQKTTYQKKGSGIKVNQWVCDHYEGYSSGEKVEEVWTTDWKKIGITPEDFKVMEEFGEFFEGFSKEMSSKFKVGSEEWEKEQGYPGIPVKSVLYRDGKIEGKTELKEVQRKDFPSSLYDLPSGLKKMKTFEE